MMKHRAGLVLAVLAVLAVLGLGVEALRLSAKRLHPDYDEISYLALGRQFAREGGTVGTIRCYLDGRCREDNRPPLYPLLLAPVVDDAPASFAHAKVVNFATMMLLLVVVVATVRRLFSPMVSLATLALLCLMPVVPDFAVRLMHDPLYATCTFAAVFAVARWQERGALHWVMAGALVGLAFLSKGSGYLLLVPLVAVSLYRHRLALLRRPSLYAAAAGFVSVSFFLLWRNLQLWHAPFHNINAGEVWLDQWRDVFVSRVSPEHEHLGLRWYLAHHSLGALLGKLGKGAGQIVGVFFYTAGVGPSHPVVRVVTGIAITALSVLGLRRHWRAGGRLDVAAVVSTQVVFFAALTLAAAGAPGPQVRFVFPYVVLSVPFAAYEIVSGLWPRLEAWLATRRPSFPVRTVLSGVVVVGLSARLALAAPGLSFAASSHYLVEPRWHEASIWLSKALAPGERFALPNDSRYSTWDLPRPDVDPRWIFWFGVPSADLLGYIRGVQIRTVMIDTADVGYPDYAEKLGAEKDAHGPLTFLGWPRCFADSDRPSRFLVYCRPAP